MFDFDTTKLLLVGVVALVVVPPKDLPRVIRQVGQAVGKVRRMAADFRGQVMDALKEAELDDLKKELSSITDSAKAEMNAITDAAKVDVDFDPAADVQREMSKAMDAPIGAAASADGAAPANPADVYARATMPIPAPAPPAANEAALAALAMPELPPVPAVTHADIAREANITLPTTPARAKRARNAENGGSLGTAGSEKATADEAGARVPYRKRVAYVPPARAARAARRES